MKFRTKTKGCKIFVKVKTSSKEIVDEKELARSARMLFRGFLTPTPVKKNILEYTGPVGITLYERLQKPITKRDFYFILEQVVVAVQKIQANNFQLFNVVFDLQNVYFNEKTKEIKFIYLPLTAVSGNTDLIDFLEKIIYSANPSDEKDNDFVSRFVLFFQSMRQFDINAIEAFIEKEDKSVVAAIRKQNAGQSGFMTSKRRHYYDHYAQEKHDEEQKKHDLQHEQTDLLVDEDQTGLLDFGDEPLTDEDEEGTNKLFGTEGYGRCATLKRVSTDEVVNIDRPAFRMGKGKGGVDYFIANNAAVSRTHAEIAVRGGKYFIKDLHSTNGTYINDQEAPSNVENELRDGDRIRLGNEEFIFNE